MASSSIPLTAAVTSPPLAVLRPYDLSTSYVFYSDAQTAVIGTEEGVFNPRARISVEISAEKFEPGKTFVNLRFSYSNRYIGRSDDGVIPVAQLKQPDTTSTLFELRQNDVTDNVYYFCHVQSQQFLMMNEALDTLEINDWTSDEPRIYFEVVDWDSLVKLPSVCAFTCDNYNYLSPYSYAGHQYLAYTHGSHSIILKSHSKMEHDIFHCA